MSKDKDKDKDDDIVTRLRKKYQGQLPICAEAADEIERLREDRDKWKARSERWLRKKLARGYKAEKKMLQGHGKKSSR